MNMLKIIFRLKPAFMFLTLGLLTPVTAFAATDSQTICSKFLAQFQGAFDWMQGRPEFCTIQGFLLWGLKQALVFAGVVAVVFIVLGGYQYLTSGGNEEAAEKGRKTLVNSVIGLVVIIMSFVIVRVVTDLITSSSVK
jgi:hypothetical protein